MHKYHYLKIWERSRSFVRDVYIVTKDFPSNERFGLTQQMRKFAVSVPSNIAEGCGRGTTAQLAYFVDISLGSLFELQTQILLAKDLQYILDATHLLNEIAEIISMTIGFRKSLPTEKKN